MKIRKGLSMLSVGAIAIAGVAFAAGPASASSGGGCGSAPVVTACISASGNHVEPDLYVTSAESNCQIDYFLYDDTTNTEVYGKDLGCLSPGHYYPGPIIGTNGHHYHSVAIVYLADATYSSVSLELAYSD